MKKAIKILQDELDYYKKTNRQYQPEDYLLVLDTKIDLLEEMIDKLKRAKKDG